ncbi:PREDICTED: uncharacterized protein LOC109206499 [Nicotiana attenuata]|uniref:uncharacterized protein LOC109206499 n=1 Tax=Nicotiana attenuata TaxID=49451 RepID=UPI000904FB0E|nr:PREDICTED: uncharacterized protein LOC109206499 [Nicotiana attenuata]
MKALSKIGSALGNPVYADDCTTGTVRISYARMLIEMDITKPLPRRVKIQDPMEYNNHKSRHIGGRENKGKQVWQRTVKDGPKDNNQEKEQTKRMEIIKPPENRPVQVSADAKQPEEEGWTTVSGKSAARMAKAKQAEEQTLAGNNGFQSLGSEKATNEPGTSSMQLRSYGAQEMYQDTQFIPWISNFSNSNKSRIWVLWDPRIFEFESIDIDDQIIHGQVRTHSRLLAFGFTAIYGLHTIKDRLSMWQKLKQINSLQQGPWLAMGDFNAVLNSQDRQHGTIIQDMERKDFREFMSDTGMNELPTMGRDYT